MITANQRECYEVSSLQEDIWRVGKGPDGGAFHSAVFSWSGRFDRLEFTAAVRRVCARFDILRSDFTCPAGMKKPLQVVRGADARVSIGFGPVLPWENGSIDLSSVGIDFAEGGLLGITIDESESGCRRARISVSGLIGDRRSLREIIGAIVEEYGATFSRPNPSADVQFAAVASYLNELLVSPELHEERTYWEKKHLLLQSRGASSFRELLPPRGAQGHRVLSSALPWSAGESVAALSKRLGATPLAVSLACWNLFLNRYFKREVAVAFLAEDRVDELARVIGPLAKHLPFSVNGSTRLPEAVRETVTILDEYSGRQELYRARGDQQALAFGFEFGTRPVRLEGDGFRVEIVEEFGHVARHEATLVLHEDGGALRGVLRTDAAVLDRSDSARIVESFGTFLAQLAADPEASPESLDIVGPKERQLLLETFGVTRRPFPTGMCLQDLFLRQVRINPDRIAVTASGADGADEQLSFAELERRSGRLAARLVAQCGVRANSPVALVYGRTVDMLVGILAVLRAGGAYVPLDPEYPDERIAYILRDSAARVVLTIAAYRARIPAGMNVITTESGSDEDPGAALPEPVASSGEDLAYIIYTSGSTGRPKGVCVQHKAAVNLVHGLEELVYRHYPAPVSVALMAPYVFDPSVQQIFASLAFGHQLCIVPDTARRDGVRLIEFLRQHDIRISDGTPMHLGILAAVLETQSDVLPVERLLIGGELLKWETVRRFLKLHRSHGGKDIVIVNLYGPTECCVDATSYEIAGEPQSVDSGVPIGRPLPNVETMVLDENGRLVPVGVEGELHIGGAGLGFGYTDAEETRRRFVAHPLGLAGKVYRTGDLVRWTPGGDLEFLGRNDRQIKFRGHRIELSEIEAVFCRVHPDVTAAVAHVLDHGEGHKTLCCYLVGGTALDVDALRARAGRELPDYMLPTFVVQIDAIPVTNNGKTDYARLPEPRKQSETSTSDAPATPDEALLAEVWREALKLDRVSLDLGFFQQGGDSIRSLMVRAKARKAGLLYSMDDFLNGASIRQLAAAAAKNRAVTAPAEEVIPEYQLSAEDRLRLPGDAEAAYPMSALQLGMIYHSEFDASSKTYIDYSTTRLAERFDEKLFRRSLEIVFQRHPILRTSLHLADFSEPMQVVHAAVAIPVSCEDLTKEKEGAQDQVISRWFHEHVERKFELDRAPLIRFGVHILGEEKFQLSWINHHAILDGWSMASLVTEIGEIGLALKNGTPPAPQPADQGVLEFVALERQAVNSESHRAFWKGMVDRIRPASFNCWPIGSAADRTGRLATPLTPELSHRLREAAHRLNLPLKTVLLSVHLRALQLLYGRSDVTTGLVFNGRPEKPGSDRILGLFLNTLPLATAERLEDAHELPHGIRNVHRQEKEMDHFRRFPLSEIKKLDANGGPLFETIFGYVNFHVYQNLRGKVRNAQEALSAGSFEQNDFLLTTIFGVNVENDALNLILKFDPRRLSGLQMESIKSTYLSVLDHFATSLAEGGVCAGCGGGKGAPCQGKCGGVTESRPGLDSGTAEPKPESRRRPAGTEQPANLPTTKENVVIAAAILENCRRLLYQEGIQLEDDFFRVGGDSISATILTARLAKQLGLKLSPRDIFDHPELHRLAAYLSSLTPAGAPVLVSGARREYYPVSFAQQRMYILHKYNPASLGYNLPRIVVVHGTLDVDRLREALQQVVDRHEILRTSYRTEGADLVQTVSNGVRVDVPYQEEPGVDARARLRQFVRPFDLTRPLPLRIEVVKFAAEAFYLFLDCHHIAFDRVSSDILWSELLAGYRAQPLPPVARQYRDYAVWQREVYEKREIQAAATYWEAQFEEPLAPLTLPYDYARPKVQGFAGSTVRFTLPEALSRNLRKICDSYSVTPNVLILALFKLLLRGYSGQSDIAVGVPVLGRSFPEVERAMGLFLNTVVVRMKSPAEMRFPDFLLAVRDAMVHGLQHQHYPFENLAAKYGNYADQSRNPIFDVMFVHQGRSNDAAITAAPDVDGLRFEVLDVDDDTAKCDLTLFVHDTPTGFAMGLNYATGLFRRETIEHLGESFRSLCEAVANDHHQTLAAMPILSRRQRDRLLSELSGNPHHREPEPGTVVDWFERRVVQHPEAAAIHFGSQSWTYRNLNERANQLAWHLISRRGVKPGALVGVLLDHRPDVFISVLAVLKAGAAFVPLGLDVPAARNNRLLKDAGVRLLLTRSDLTEANGLEIERLELDQQVIDTARTANPARDEAAARLAYVIFTSGSTGEPKGVLIEHPSLSNYISWASRTYVRGERCGFAFYSALNFDLTITSLFLPIVTGGHAVIIPRGDIQRTFQMMLDDPRIDILKATPTHLLVLRALTTQNSRIRRFIVGGEDLKSSLAGEVAEKFPHPVEIYNEYGPTEGTVGCMIYQYAATDPGKSVAIGTAIDNVRLYVVDGDLNLVPFGVKGELCIGGACLAKGYLNAGDKASPRFIDSPFVAGERLYRTGDYVQWLHGDKMLYLGRLDNQVKVRGYRIELGEIEAALRSLVRFEFLTVRVMEVESEPAVTAYFTAREPVDVAAIRTALGRLLPSYMLPSYFVELDTIPLTPNGKLNDAALPRPKGDRAAAGAVVPPATALEHAMLDIWKRVLGTPEIGVTHNFFDSGGHSLKALDAHAQIQAHLGRAIPFVHLITYPTIRTLAKTVENELGAGSAGRRA